LHTANAPYENLQKGELLSLNITLFINIENSSGNDYLTLKFASVSFLCQVSDTGSAGCASS